MSAPNSLLERVARASQALGLEQTRVLVAASAGIDSTCLLDALCELRGKLDLEVAVGHVDHCLRGSESEADRHFVSKLAAERGCVFVFAEVDPAALREGTSSRERLTVQEAARSLRYAALHRLREDVGAQRIATAHTANDQAETLLLRLLRGAGPAALGGIPEQTRDGRVVRPLLDVSRAEIEVWMRESEVGWREDASNASASYARNRIRHELIPQLESNFNGRVLRTLANFAETTRRDTEWIDSIVAAEAGRRFETVRSDREIRVVISAVGWDEVPEALARRLALRLFTELGLGREASRSHLERVIAFLKRGEAASIGRAIELPCGAQLSRTSEAFEAVRASGAEAPAGTAC